MLRNIVNGHRKPHSSKVLLLIYEGIRSRRMKTLKALDKRLRKRVQYLKNFLNYRQKSDKLNSGSPLLCLYTKRI